MPAITNSILFNTDVADAIVSAMQIFPVTNAWNEDISRLPVLVNSDAMIAQIIADLSAGRRKLQVFEEMNFVLVPDNQVPVPIQFVDYPDESDPGPYPIPWNMPVEGWPSEVTNSFQSWQQDTNNVGGDRHAIIVQPGGGYIWEMWQAKLLTNGAWQAANGAKFNLNTNGLRPAGWTSGDAAGLPMFPALVRYDECRRGMVEHACRIVVARSRAAYIYPATHYASSTPATQTNVPAMGQRLRLKSGFAIPSGWAPEERALLLGLKKYGALVADNGNFFSISICPDDRWSPNAFGHIFGISITNFEIVQSTGPNGGPRSAGAPVASAGPDQSVPIATPAQLQVYVHFSGGLPVIRWTQYAGPAAVTFGDATQTNTTASFSAPGAYTLLLSADDGIHAAAYDAVNITVGPAAIVSTIQITGTTASITWAGGSGPYVVESAAALPGAWSGVLTTSQATASIPITTSQGFFRVRGQ